MKIKFAKIKSNTTNTYANNNFERDKVIKLNEVIKDKFDTLNEPSKLVTTPHFISQLYHAALDNERILEDQRFENEKHLMDEEKKKLLQKEDNIFLYCKQMDPLRDENFDLKDSIQASNFYIQVPVQSYNNQEQRHKLQKIIFPIDDQGVDRSLNIKIANLSQLIDMILYDMQKKSDLNTQQSEELNIAHIQIDELTSEIHKGTFSIITQYQNKKNYYKNICKQSIVVIEENNLKILSLQNEVQDLKEQIVQFKLKITEQTRLAALSDEDLKIEITRMKDEYLQLLTQSEEQMIILKSDLEGRLSILQDQSEISMRELRTAYDIRIEKTIEETDIKIKITMEEMDKQQLYLEEMIAIKQNLQETEEAQEYQLTSLKTQLESIQRTLQSYKDQLSFQQKQLNESIRAEEHSTEQQQQLKIKLKDQELRYAKFIEKSEIQIQSLKESYAAIDLNIAPTQPILESRINKLTMYYEDKISKLKSLFIKNSSTNQKPFTHQFVQAVTLEDIIIIQKQMKDQQTLTSVIKTDEESDEEFKPPQKSLQNFDFSDQDERMDSMLILNDSPKQKLDLFIRINEPIKLISRPSVIIEKQPIKIITEQTIKENKGKQQVYEQEKQVLWKETNQKRTCLQKQNKLNNLKYSLRKVVLSKQLIKNMQLQRTTFQQKLTSQFQDQSQQQIRQIEKYYQEQIKDFFNENETEKVLLNPVVEVKDESLLDTIPDFNDYQQSIEIKLNEYEAVKESLVLERQTQMRTEFELDPQSQNTQQSQQSQEITQQYKYRKEQQKNSQQSNSRKVSQEITQQPHQRKELSQNHQKKDSQEFMTPIKINDYKGQKVSNPNYTTQKDQNNRIDNINNKQNTIYSQEVQIPIRINGQIKNPQKILDLEKNKFRLQQQIDQRLENTQLILNNKVPLPIPKQLIALQSEQTPKAGNPNGDVYEYIISQRENQIAVAMEQSEQRIKELNIVKLVYEKQFKKYEKQFAELYQLTQSIIKENKEFQNQIYDLHEQIEQMQRVLIGLQKKPILQDQISQTHGQVEPDSQIEMRINLERLQNQEMKLQSRTNELKYIIESCQIENLKLKDIILSNDDKIRTYADLRILYMKENQKASSLEEQLLKASMIIQFFSAELENYKQVYNMFTPTQKKEDNKVKTVQMVIENRILADKIQKLKKYKNLTTFENSTKDFFRTAKDPNKTSRQVNIMSDAKCSPKTILPEIHNESIQQESSISLLEQVERCSQFNQTVTSKQYFFRQGAVLVQSLYNPQEKIAELSSKKKKFKINKSIL